MTPSTTGRSLAELQTKVKRYAGDLDLEATFFQTNHEGEFVEYLHRLPERADAALLNPGAWTHYSYAIRDAVEIAAVPAVEVHLSNVDSREEWRKSSVLDGLVIDVVSGEGRRVPARARDPQRETEKREPRRARLAGLAGERELDQLLVGDLVRPGDSDRRGMANLRYLTGFTGTSGLCLVGERVGGGDELESSSRTSATRSARTVRSAPSSSAPPRRVSSCPRSPSGLAGRVGYDDANTSVRNLRKLEEVAPEGVELVPAAGLVEELRRAKEFDELASIAEAQRLDRRGVRSG